MMSVATPWILGASVAGALVTALLHLLSVRKPPTLMLPTMRFLPERSVRAVSRSARPSDLLLLLLRISALLLAGVALSGVSWRSSKSVRGRVVVIDRGAIVRDTALLRARAAEELRGTAEGSSVLRIVLTDSVARVLSATETARFRADTLTVAPGVAPLSSELLAAMRAAASLVREQSQIDSVELVLITPLVSASVDASLATVRAAWPGQIRLVDVRGDTALVDSVVVSRRARFVGARPSEGVLSAFAARGWWRAGNARASDAGGTRLSDTGSLGATVEWPESGVPEGWMQIKADTAGALIAHGQALVARFVRRARAPQLTGNARAIAWWNDGAVAAIESGNGISCRRQVGVTIARAGDVLQSASARALLSALVAPCGRAFDFRPLSDAERAMLTGSGSVAPASAFRDVSAVRTPFALVWLALALVLLALEWWLRDRDVMGPASEPRAVAPEGAV